MNSKFSYRFFEENNENLLAICDFSILGKVITDKKKGLEISVSEFYTGNFCKEKVC